MHSIARCAIPCFAVVVWTAAWACGQVVIGGAAGVAGGRATAKTMVANYKVHATLSQAKFVQLSIVDGLLEGRLVAEVPNQVEPVRIQVEGSDAVWVVRNRALGGGPYTTITRYDFDAPDDGIWSTVLSVRTSYLMISAQTGDTMNGKRLRLTQSNRTLRMQVTHVEKGQHREIFAANAETLRQLQVEHPNEVRQYLAPAVRMITGRWLFKPGAADVYRVFGTIAPDPETSAEVGRIILGLEADAFAQREAASKSLGKLGPRGVLAILRRDRADLSPEARNRLDAFVAGHSNLDMADVERARRDPHFLLDCLDDADADVRGAAKQAMEALLKRPVDFDPAAAEGPARAAAIDKLRQEIDKSGVSATRPTTKPAL